MLFRVFASLMVVCAVVAPLSAQSPLVEAVQRAGAELWAGGFVLAESQHGDTRFTAAGKPGPRAETPPEKILFEIGSITKVFTGLLLAQGVIDGKVSLADSIAKHLPADVALDPKAAAITLEQLSTHTSGLPRLPANFAPANRSDPYADYSVERLYHFLRGYHPGESPPQPPAYSNLGVGLLGHLLERAYGQSYAELLAAKITRPLGLDDTVITLSDEQQARFAPPHSGSMEVLPWQLGALQGAGAIRSTAADLLKFGRALIAANSPIHAAWEIARAPRADQKIGLGIGIGSIDGKTLYRHNGGTGGFRSYFVVVPENDRVMAVLLNNDDPAPEAIVENRRPPAAQTKTNDRVEVPIDPAKLTEYTGTFQLREKRVFTVIVDDEGQLRIRLTGQPFGKVSFAGNDCFFNRAAAAEFRFARGAEGRITSVTLHQNNVAQLAARTSDATPTVRFLRPNKLNEYVGSYTLGPMAVFDISTRAGHVTAKLTGQPVVPVFCDREDHFVYDVVNAALTFERNEAGAITALVLHQNGIDQRAPRAPEAVRAK
jgi:serine-type D-Ala-D-Ala carboxypeptidase/endopeptidase